MKKMILFLLLIWNPVLHAQVILLEESFENEIPASWDHCSGNWGGVQIWSNHSGYLKESSGPYFGRVLNGLLLPHIDLNNIDNPILEFEYALGEIDSSTQLSVYYTYSDSCATVWDTINGGYLLDNWNHLASYGKTNVITSNDWVPVDTDFQTVQIELEPFLLDSLVRFGIVSDYQNIYASGNWFIDNLKIYGNSTTATFNQTATEPSIDLFPNPANKSVNIWLRQTTDTAKLKVFSNSGQLMVYQEMNGNRDEIEVSNFPKGLYFLQCILPDRILLKKFVVQ